MHDTLFPPDPLGWPAGFAVLVSLKVLGFLWHALCMHIWLIGLPLAAGLIRRGVPLGERILRSMPFVLAFGINGGIVPLLFLQTLYGPFFFTTTILAAWFWLSVIPALLIAYSLVYLAVSGWRRVLTSLVASGLLFAIGGVFASTMHHMAQPDALVRTFLTTADAGAVAGTHFWVDAASILRYALTIGMACGTTAVWIAWLVSRSGETGFREASAQWIWHLYGLGTIVYALAGWLYRPYIRAYVPDVWMWLTGASVPLAFGVVVIWSRHPTRRWRMAMTIAHLLAVGMNGISRQIVQTGKLAVWTDQWTVPVRYDWGGITLFLITLGIGIGIVYWIARKTIWARSATDASGVQPSGK